MERTRPPGSGWQSAGFTLIELSIVLAVSAAILAVTLPRVQQSAARADARRAAIEFVQMVESAARAAASSESVICVERTGAVFNLYRLDPGAASPCAGPLGPVWRSFNHPLLDVGPFTVTHVRPLAPQLAAGPGVVWAVNEHGQPAGLAGAPTDNNLWGLGAPPYNGFPHPHLALQASFSGGLARVDVTHYVAGTVVAVER